MKNPTPLRTSLVASGAIGLICGLLMLAMESILPGRFVLSLVLCCCGAGLFAYLIISSLLRRYLYRKIKPIYKLIKKTKVSKKEKGQIALNEAVFDDVEDEVSKWVEEQEKEISSLKEMEQYRREFIGNVSHELKTPIFSIQGFIETLADNALEKERRDFYFERTKKNIERLITIVEDLELISKIESKAFELELTDFSIRELTLEVFSDMNMITQKKNISLVMKTSAKEDYLVQADRESIRQVLTNLVMNSLKYGKIGGETKIGLYDLDKDILIEIADNGVGIQEEHLKYVFDRFYRIDKSRSREQGGSGLGLSIVKHIIEAHGQTINVRSTFDKGSTFGFTLKKA